MNDLAISLPAQPLFLLGPIVITDAFFGAFVVSVALIAFSILAARKFSIIPTRIQVVFEWMAEYLLEQLESAFGTKHEARRYFALIFTLLLFVVVANQFTLLPLIFEITYNGADVLRQPTSDLAGTLSLSLIVVVVANVMAFGLSPLNHLKNFFPIHLLFKARSLNDVFMACIELFLGVLNIVGEFAKVISLAARLFGNIFAGNVMAAVIASLVPYVVPLPFLFLSIFSGFIQAFVFMALSLQFIALSIKGSRPQIEEAHNTSAEATA